MSYHLAQPVDEKFGDYSLIERIGLGGMAEVFLARRSGVAGFEKEIVIKRIRAHRSDDPSFVEMFLHEAKLAARLTHPNIAHIYDLGQIDGSYYIAMEHVAGRDLSTLVEQTRKLNIPFPVEYILRIGRALCEALSYAHAKHDTDGAPLRIVHRDVSPENIRIAWTGAVKLLDFGIAEAANTSKKTDGEIKGKLCYMSPEQVLGKELDARSDLFSLGVVLYEALTGLKLFEGATNMDVMTSVVEKRIYKPSYFRDDIPAEVERIIMKALSRSRTNRYQSAAEMQFDLDQFLTQHEFTPNRTHLAGFLNQCFGDERDQEETRRSSRGPTTDPAHQAKRPQLLALPGGKSQASTGAGPTEQLLTVPLDTPTVKRLQDMAWRKQMGMGQLLRSIVETYLKDS